MNHLFTLGWGIHGGKKNIKTFSIPIMPKPSVPFNKKYSKNNNR